MRRDPAEETRAHYERHPYPAGATLDWSPYTRQLVDFFSGRVDESPLPERARVLVAGCGTREAALWALAMPESEVVGVDVSEASLARHRRVVQALGLANCRLQRADIMTLAPGDLGGPFDLIVSFGVVHHLADPAAGLARLSALLAPDGVLQLMVYSATHRRPVRELDDIAHALAPPGAEAETRVAALVQLAQAAVDTPGPLREPLAMVLEQAAGDPAALMDTFGHPHYATYTVDGLWELLARADLRFLSWARPGEWRVGTYLDPGPAAARLEDLPPRTRYDVMDRLFAPLFIAYAERRDRPVVPGPTPYEAGADALLQRVFKVAHRCRIDFDEAGRPAPVTPYGPSVDVQGDVATLSFRPEAVYEEHALLIPVLQSCNGERTLGEVIAAVAEATGAPPGLVKQVALDAARALLSPHDALVPLR
jgi:SAM-dependent methyltransferase